MADTPVIVPVQLEVTDLDMSNVDMSDVQKSMTKKLTDLSKSVNNAMSAIGKSGQANKAITSSMTSVERSVTKVSSMYDKFNTALNKAGKSSEVYKAKMQELEQAQAQLYGEGGIASQKALFENADGDFTGTESMWETYLGLCEKYEVELYKIMDLQQEVQDPSKFASTGSPETVDKVTAAYRSLISAITDSNSKVDNFNDTLANNQYTDAYTAKLKELEAAQKKITALSEKSQKMSQTGASEGAWKSLRADADLLSQKIVEIQADLTKMVQEGQAFRFGGDGAAEIDAINSRIQRLLGLLGEVNTRGKATPESIIKGFKKVDKTLTKIGKSISSIISKMFKLKKSGTSTTNSLQKGFKKLLKNFMMFGLGFRSMYFLVKKLRTVFMDGFKYLSQGFPEINSMLSKFMTSINQLKGSVVTAFQPIANIVLPILTSFINKLSQAMNALGKFFATLTGQGYIYEFTSDNIDCAESMKKTAGAAKKAQKALMGFDEINRLDDNSDSGTDTGAQGTWNKVDIEGATSSLAEMIKKCWEQEDFTSLGVFLGEKLKQGLDKATSMIEGKILDTGTKIANALATTINGFVSVDGLANSLGGIVGATINTAMSILDKFLVTTNWLDVGKFIADTINGFITKTDFSLIGKTVGDLVLAGINLFWSTVTNIDFTNIGNKIFEAINNMFATLGATDITGLSGWQKLGQGISNAVTGILKLMITALQNTDWQQVGVAIGEFIGSIDWSQITWDLVKLVSSFVSGLCQAFYEWSNTDPLSAAIASLIGLAIVGIKVIPGILTVAPKVVSAFKGIGEVIALVAGGAGTLHEALTAVFGTIKTTIGGIVLVITGVAMAVTNFFSMLKDGFSWLKEILMVIGIALAAVGAVILGAPAAVAAAVAGIVAAIMTAVVLIKEHWNEIVQFFKETWENIKKSAAETWENITKKLDETKKSILATFENIKNDVTQSIDAVKQFFTDAWESTKEQFFNTLESIKAEIELQFNNIKTFLTDAWNSIKAKALETWENMKTSVSNTITEIKTTVTETITAIKDWWTNTWNEIKNTAITTWENIKLAVVTAIEIVKTTITNIVTSIKTWWTTTWETIKTTVTNIMNGIKTTITNVVNAIKTFWTNTWNSIKTTISTVWTNIKTTVSNSISSVKTTISNVINTIKSTWNAVWDSIKTRFTNIWDGIKSAIRNSINSIIGFVNRMMSAVANGINTVIGALNRLNITVPNWVPGLGGSSFGFNLSTVSAPQIPYLAQGAVIPPNKEFMAVLGDQKNGTNIEAPLSTIQEAVATVMDDQLDALMAGFEAIIKAINDKDLLVAIGDKDIGMAANRFNRRQNLVKGGI